MVRRVSTSRSSRRPQAFGDQTFEVVCPCGETLFGQRQPDAQTLPCPRCKAPLFVLPQDCYAGAASLPPLHKSEQASTRRRGLIEKLNRLAFWTRLREGRTTIRGQVGSAVRRFGEWMKTRFSPDRRR